jgi:hypothetical protein
MAVCFFGVSLRGWWCMGGGRGRRRKNTAERKALGWPKQTQCRRQPATTTVVRGFFYFHQPAVRLLVEGRDLSRLPASVGRRGDGIVKATPQPKYAHFQWHRTLPRSPTARRERSAGGGEKPDSAPASVDAISTKRGRGGGGGGNIRDVITRHKLPAGKK